MHFLSNLWGRITGKDAGKNVPQQQGKSLDRAGDFFSAQPYGMYANLPDGQLFKVIDEEGRVILGVTVERPPNVKQGEVSLWHPGTGTVIHFKNNGDLNIDTAVDNAGDININTVNANVTASENVNVTCVDADLTASGDITASCVNATITASTKIIFDTPIGEFTGNLDVAGNLTTLNFAASGTMTNDSEDVGKDHGHTQGDDSAGDSQDPISGVT